MTLENMFNEMKVLASELAISEPYLSGFANYYGDGVEVQLYKADSGYYYMRYEGFGNRIEYHEYDTPQITFRKGNLTTKNIKSLFEKCEAVIAEHHHNQAQLEKAELEAKKLARIKELEEALAEVKEQ